MGWGLRAVLQWHAGLRVGQWAYPLNLTAAAWEWLRLGARLHITHHTSVGLLPSGP